MKRISALLLAAVLIAVLLPAAAHADDNNTSGDWIYAANGGSATITGYTGTGGDVKVPDTIGGLTVTGIGAAAFEGKTAVTAITVPASVTAIGIGAFRNCTGLVSAHLPANVTVIEDESFRGCICLANLVMPDNLIGIGEYAFAGCEALKSVSIPKWVNNISAHAFEGCAALDKAYFYGAPPAVSTTAFAATAAGFTACYHVSQTGWGSFTNAPAKAFCRLTLELLNGAAPADSFVTLAGNLLDTAPATPVRQGYSFGGWYREAALINRWDPKAGTVAGDFTVFAKWIPSTCTVTFDSQGGSAAAPFAVPYGSAIAPPAVPTRVGSFFGGWYREVACSNAWNFSTDTLKGSVTLYARWLVPTVPDGVKALSASYNSITIHWRAAAHVTGYEVYRFTAATGKYELVTVTYGSSYLDEGLTAGTKYYYKVRSFKQLETQRLCSEFSAAVPSRPLPASPGAVKTERLGTNSVRLSWGAVEGAAKYEVWRADKADGPFRLLRTTASASFTDSRLNAGTAYSYQVRAYRVVKGKRVYGPYCAVVAASPH